MRKAWEDTSAPVIVIFRLWKLPFYLVSRNFLTQHVGGGWKIKGDERKCFAKIILFPWNKLRSKILPILRYFVFFLFFFFFSSSFFSLFFPFNTARNTLEKKDKFCENQKNIKYFAKIILFFVKFRKTGDFSYMKKFLFFFLLLLLLPLAFIFPLFYLFFPLPTIFITLSFILLFLLLSPSLLLLLSSSSLSS